MKRGAIWIFCALSILVISSFVSVSAIKINEFVVDPQTDWDGSNTTGASDEWIEIYNEGTESVNLTFWKLVMNDSSPSTESLQGIIEPKKYLVVLNPSGDMTLNGQVLLLDISENIIDSVSYGNWNDSNIDDNAPDGNAVDLSDECLARMPNGADTDNDKNDFVKQACTYGKSNDGEENQTEDNSQELNVTIGETITFRILPTTLQFGLLLPGSMNNPALNGPIILDANGSNTNVHVAVSEVRGFPFDQGLRLDGEVSVGKNWVLNCVQSGDYCSYIPIEIVPTLNIPPGAVAGTANGEIRYTVSGTPPD